MKLETRVFELVDGKYGNMSDLAQAMGISASHVYRVRRGERRISEKFIVGAMKAFPGNRLEDLFYFASEGKPFELEPGRTNKAAASTSMPIVAGYGYGGGAARLRRKV